MGLHVLAELEAAACAQHGKALWWNERERERGRLGRLKESGAMEELVCLGGTMQQRRLLDYLLWRFLVCLCQWS